MVVVVVEVARQRKGQKVRLVSILGGCDTRQRGRNVLQTRKRLSSEQHKQRELRETDRVRSHCVGCQL